MCPPSTCHHPSKIPITIKQIYRSNNDIYFKKVLQLEYTKFGVGVGGGVEKKGIVIVCTI